MAHKVHPKAFRISETKDWHSRGFYEKNFASLLKEDYKIRKFLEDRLKKYGVGGVEIERSPGKVNIIINTSRPGLVIGRSGEGIEGLRKTLINKVLRSKGEKREKKGLEKDLKMEVREIKNIWISAPLVAQYISSQIERRMPYRRVLKKTLSKVMSQKGVQGARLEVSGRLNGIDIARTEWLQEGELPRQTIRADIDYTQDTAFCTYGAVGIKVWIYKGEVFE